jgi:hypothetical protein
VTTTPLAVFGLTDEPAWMDKRAELAPCAQTDPELWFPEKGGSVRVPRRLCRECPFLAACRTWALEHPHEAAHGIWGGLTVRERARILRDRRRAGSAPVPDESMREVA